MADNILFKSGLASNMKDTKIAGQLLFAIDGTSGSIYLDKDANTRIKMNLDATKLQNARKINGIEFDGTQDITTSKWGTARTVIISDNDGTNTQSNANIDGSTNFTLKLPATIKATLIGKASTAGHADTAGSATTAASCTGNAGSATKLLNKRLINGTEFDGSMDITTSSWGTARNFTIGDSKKSVNGSTEMSWTLSEIGAVSKAGDTMNGILTGKTISTSWLKLTHEGSFRTNEAAAHGAAASILSMKTKNGSWGIANYYDNDNLYFIFGTDTNYNANINTTNNYYIDTLGNFSGSAAKWTNPRNIKINGIANTPVETANLDGSQNVSLNIPTTITNFTKVESDTFVVNDKVTLQYNSKNECLEFVFA